MTNATSSPPPWDAFRSGYDQYANPHLGPHAKQTFYVPGVGNAVRGYSDGSGVGQVLSGQGGGEESGGANMDFSGLNPQAKDAYNQRSDSQRYGYSALHDFVFADQP